MSEATPEATPGFTHGATEASPVPGATNGLATATFTSSTNATQPPPAAPTRTFTQEDIERARREEKDKLYGRLSGLEEELKAIRAERDARQQEAAQKAAEKEAAARAKREEEMSLKALLAEKEQEWESRFDSIQQEREQERALRQKEQEFFALQQYIQQQVAQNSDKIAPELIDMVSGNSPEEVDASVASLIQRTERIFEAVQSAQVQARAGMRGVSPTGYAPTGPMDTDPAHQSFSVEDLKNMPMEKYAQIRGKLGLGLQGQRDRGLFG